MSSRRQGNRTDQIPDVLSSFTKSEFMDGRMSRRQDTDPVLLLWTAQAMHSAPPQGGGRWHEMPVTRPKRKENRYDSAGKQTQSC